MTGSDRAGPNRRQAAVAYANHGPLIERVISGGQTGADQAGLAVAKKRGIPTGGHMPIARQSKWKRHDNQEEDLGIAARACLSCRDDIASPFLIVVARRSRACFDGRT